MENLQFNGNFWKREVGLYRWSERTEKLELPLILFEDNISQLQVISDLNDPLLRIEITFDDTSNKSVPKYPADGRSFINLYMEYIPPKEPSGKQPPSIKFVYNFVIQDVVEISTGAEHIIYTIKGISELKSIWDSKIDYSTKGAIKSATKVIEEILYDVKYPFKKDINFLHSSHKGDYISPTNYSVGDNINKILEYANNNDTGLYFVRHNFSDGRLELHSLRKSYKDFDIDIKKFGKIPSKYGFADMEIMAEEWEVNSFIKGVENYEYANDVTLNNFNYLKREWTKDIYDHQRLDKFLPKPNRQFLKSDSNFKSIPSMFTNKSLYRIEREPLNYSWLGSRMQNFFNFKDVLEVSCRGYIERNPGDLFVIGYDSDETSNYYRYVGAWTISRIYHTFTKGSLDQTISMVRNDRIPETGWF